MDLGLDREVADLLLDYIERSLAAYEYSIRDFRDDICRRRKEIVSLEQLYRLELDAYEQLEWQRWRYLRELEALLDEEGSRRISKLPREVMSPMTYGAVSNPGSFTISAFDLNWRDLQKERTATVEARELGRRLFNKCGPEPPAFELPPIELQF